MDDTRPSIAEKVIEMFQQKTPIERMKMGFSMHATSKHLISSSLQESDPVYSGIEWRQRMFSHFYGNDFGPAQRQKIMEYLGQSFFPQMEIDFSHIPKEEKTKAWWRLLDPIVQARLLKENQEKSRLLHALNKKEGGRIWKNVKKVVELALNQVDNGEQMFSRTSAIEQTPDPDGIIDHLFGELRTIPYLLFKGFKNISYLHRNEASFQVEFECESFYIESNYIQGHDFKIQELFYFENRLPNFRINSDKLVKLFDQSYKKQEKKVNRNKCADKNTIIIMVTDLEESYAPWLDHIKVEGRHPLVNLISNWEIPTVIFGSGSVYEPHNDIFRRLRPFDWDQWIVEFYTARR